MVSRPINRWQMACRDGPLPWPRGRNPHRHISWRQVYLCTYGRYPHWGFRKNCNRTYLRRDCTNVQVRLLLLHNSYRYMPWFSSSFYVIIDGFHHIRHYNNFMLSLSCAISIPKPTHCFPSKHNSASPSSRNVFSS